MEYNDRYTIGKIEVGGGGVRHFWRGVREKGGSSEPPRTPSGYGPAYASQNAYKSVLRRICLYFSRQHQRASTRARKRSSAQDATKFNGAELSRFTPANASNSANHLPVSRIEFAADRSCNYVREHDMYEGARTRVKSSIGLTDMIPVGIGLHQGSSLSPYLFAMIMDVLAAG